MPPLQNRQNHLSCLTSPFDQYFLSALNQFNPKLLEIMYFVLTFNKSAKPNLLNVFLSKYILFTSTFLLSSF